MIHPLTKPYVELTDEQKESKKLFESSDDWVNQHLHKTFGQNDEKGIAKGFVMLDETETQIVGCYSIAMYQVDFRDLSKTELKQLGTINNLPTTRPLPVCLLVSFGLDQCLVGRGLGESLLIEALMRIYEISKNAGGLGVIIDVSNDKVRGFYEKYGFKQVPLPDKNTRYFLPMKELSDLFEPSDNHEENS
ncbi:hypothetical protein [Acinetobacter sp. ANC 3791]|uniref:hypothetical protein n=1 Tax=Acinetobacter sp. ANC 3791 TaxID=2529836 RepID=UPI0010401FC0|nr:hypothetical protein [Acinetobacter sp. ANC 3791]TCB80888.1 hypothetical protein E0H90_15340 [Acinetobacter sp. ANC 3791]